MESWIIRSGFQTEQIKVFFLTHHGTSSDNVYNGHVHHSTSSNTYRTSSTACHLLFSPISFSPLTPGGPNAVSSNSIGKQQGIWLFGINDSDKLAVFNAGLAIGLDQFHASLRKYWSSWTLLSFPKFSSLTHRFYAELEFSFNTWPMIILRKDAFICNCYHPSGVYLEFCLLYI